MSVYKDLGPVPTEVDYPPEKLNARKLMDYCKEQAEYHANEHNKSYSESDKRYHQGAYYAYLDIIDSTNYNWFTDEGERSWEVMDDTTIRREEGNK